MTREQVKDLFKFLVMVYPNFDVSTDKLDTWTRLLNNQNPTRVMRRAESYALENVFPPTVAHLAERIDETRNSDFLRKVDEWRANASGKPRS